VPNLNSQGIIGAYDQSPQVRNDMSVVAINWFANRCPLVTRLPRVPVGSVTFKIHSRTYRKRTAATAAAVANNTVATITLDDASPFMVGDVLELDTGERVEITADPPSNNVVTVKRGVSGTTAAAANNATTVTLIGNSRTGQEVDQNAIGLIPTGVDQYCQTFQHPVQVGGSLQSSSSFVLQPGAAAPLDQFKMDALQNLMDDIEVSSYYGKGEAPTSGGRPKMKGISALIAAGNITTSPTNAGSYKSTDLIRDLLEKARSGGGEPDVLVVSTNFLTGLAIWGQAVQQINAGTNVFGTPLKVFEAPFLSGIMIVEAPLLKSYTAMALTSAEVRMRTKRNEFWSPRGNRGDAVEGDFIAEMAVEVDNPAHHAWVQGITAFA
jgi:hypothetical protein